MGRPQRGGPYAYFFVAFSKNRISAARSSGEPMRRSGILNSFDTATDTGSRDHAWPHSALMPAALMIGHHFSISAFW